MSKFSPSNGKKEHVYKILVIGDCFTGKTTWIQRYVNKKFDQNYKSTIGVDFALKVINWDPNTLIRLQLCDIAGQERMFNMTRAYYKDAVGCFIVFDVSKESSFDSVIRWKGDLDSKVSLPDGSLIPCVLLANKCDLIDDNATKKLNRRMNEFCRDNGFVGWFWTSAKKNINIEKAAKFLVSKIYETELDLLRQEEHTKLIKLTLENPSKKEKPRRCCLLN